MPVSEEAPAAPPEPPKKSSERWQCSCSKCMLPCTCKWCEQVGKRCRNRQSCALRGRQCSTCFASGCKGKRAKRLRTKLKLHEAEPVVETPKASAGFLSGSNRTLFHKEQLKRQDMVSLLEQCSPQTSWFDAATGMPASAPATDPHVLARVTGAIIKRMATVLLCAGVSAQMFIEPLPDDDVVGIVSMSSGDVLGANEPLADDRDKLVLALAGCKIVASAPRHDTVESELFALQSRATSRVNYLERGDWLYLPAGLRYQIKNFGDHISLSYCLATPANLDW